MSDRKRIQAVFYRAASGSEPVRDWLLDLSTEDRRIIGYDIATAEFGWPVGMPVSRPTGQGLFEIRSTLLGKEIKLLFAKLRGSTPWHAIIL